MSIVEIITKDEKTKKEKQKGKCRCYIKWKPRSEEMSQKIKSGS